jgi:hypothetical protein
VSVTVEKLLTNVGDFDLETHATSSMSSVTGTFVAAVEGNADADALALAVAPM